MTKVLITGGAGFIGSNLSLKLLEQGYEVTVLDTLSTQIHGPSPFTSSPLFLSIKDKVRFIHGTVTSADDLKKAIEGQHIIVHLAAETGTGQSMYEIKKYTDVNIGGTALLLDILANTPNHGITKFVIASSRAIYGEGKYLSNELGIVYPEHRIQKDMDAKDFEVKYEGCLDPLQLLATDENSKIHPSSVYGITKQNQEQMVMTVCPAIGIAPVAFRYQNVYGPGQSLKNPYTGILSIFSTQIKNGSNISIFEDGKESRDFVYINDVVDATLLGIEKQAANGQVYNVGTGVATDVVSVAQTLITNYNSNTTITITGNYRIGDIRHNFADLTKIQKELGFVPKFSFEKGIRLFTEWVDSQEINADQFANSINELKAKGLFK